MLILILLPVAFFLPPRAGAGKTIGFQEAQPHSRPYMAYLDIRRGDIRLVCGGFLVSENFVLTVAHCNGDKITVTLGAHNIREQEQSQQKISVRRQIPHPQFSKETHNNDIMLLQLAERAKLNRWVDTIALPRTNERVKPGTMCSIAGDPIKGKDPVLQGFGGAPLVCGKTAQGIVSWGSLDGSLPGVYTRVSTFIPWIQEIMRL